MENINFLRPKYPVEYRQPELLKAVLVFVASFFIVYSVLNFPAFVNKYQLLKNNFSDADERAETDILKEKYRDQNVLFVTEIKKENRLSIPGINVDAPIILGSSADTNQILKDLENGVVIYPDFGLPGQGTTIILGHSSSNSPWNKYSNVFSSLNKLETSDIINVTYGNKDYVYTVNSKKTGSIFTLGNSDIKGDLILSSCWPVGTDKGRIIITADLL